MIKEKKKKGGLEHEIQDSRRARYRPAPEANLSQAEAVLEGELFDTVAFFAHKNHPKVWAGLSHPLENRLG
ncbi:hypothetical protein A3K63_03880 [Candidatus Micrarchaeota archaeon RBG_16_49_10]|nr:MAG: hypothetical protein A3K63_03880 [Candidatus Micrarchaeota archaeon RBG_16_49_10]